MWEHLDKNNLVVFPRPAFGRIPNFKGSAEAAAKLLELEEFKNAKSVEVSICQYVNVNNVNLKLTCSCINCQNSF